MTQNNRAALPALAADDDHHQFLTFMLGGDALAIGIRQVREILEYGGLTQVPMMPDFVRGVINLRGAVVPVIDLAARFGRGRTVTGNRTCVVIVETDAGEIQHLGVLVDAVNEVLDIAPADIEPPPRFGTHIRQDFIHGMAKVRGDFIIVLDMDHVLSLAEANELADGDERLALAAG